LQHAEQDRHVAARVHGGRLGKLSDKPPGRRRESRLFFVRASAE